MNKSLCSGVPPIQKFVKIGSHLRLQDTKCSSIDMPAPPPPLENWTLVTPLSLLQRN